MTIKKNRNKGNYTKKLANQKLLESYGPYGIRIKGTLKYIHSRYVQYQQDALLAGDKVRSKSFQEYIEHYSRLMAYHKPMIDKDISHNKNEKEPSNVVQESE